MTPNILTYHFQPHPTWGPPCTRLLQRIENHDFQAFTALHVLGEVAHRLMTIEASNTFGWPFAGIGNRLRANPLEVRRLTGFRLAIEKLLQSRLQILPASPATLAAAVALSQQHDLLTNDALTVSVMQSNGLTRLASVDADFDRVPGLTRHAPA